MDLKELTKLKGEIERITYANEESGFTIARVKVSGRRQMVTVVGRLLAVTPGTVLEMEGEWVIHPRYGEQFKLTDFKSRVPASLYGIQKYLGSGLIKGIGPIMAKRIVEKFGHKTLQVIEDQAEMLVKVEGIGAKRIQMVKEAWEEHQEIRELLLFLESHGISSGYAPKIFRRYGNDAIEVVRENPYALATDILGIGFLTADRMAEKLGFDKNSELRVQAGSLYVLQKFADEGHVYFPYEPLVRACQQILQVDREVILKAFAALVVGKRIVIEDLNQALEEFRQNNKAVYLATLYRCETGIAWRLKKLAIAAKSIRRIDTQKAIDWVQKRLAITLAVSQVRAVRCAVEDKVMVITGGPGTGKTTIINAILKIFKKLNADILLAAPTGRAAKRMSEATGGEAKTIHRLLEYSIQKGGFQRNEENQLRCDFLVVDEASMIDVVLMYHLLKAISPGCTLILVGDVNQLPSVGPGSVLQSIINSRTAPVMELNEIFRQAQESSIIVNSHRINRGVLPSLKPSEEKIEDFYFIEQEVPEEISRVILELAKERIPKRFGLDPVDDIQVITPMHKGVVGAENLNTLLQRAFNPTGKTVIRGGRSFRINDKVMQTRNNYEKEVFNGDIGRITRIDTESQELTVLFYGRRVLYDYADLDEVVLAYAVSVHKSQGSEYPAVIVPIHTQHYVLLQRNLIYTAVTRGRSLVVLVGTRKALAIGVKNDKMRKRYSYLRYRLM